MEKENAAQNAALREQADRTEPDGIATGGFGKFKSADALLNAYNSLEAEFTRRSQRLRELEERERAAAEQTAGAKKAQEDEGGSFERRVRSIAEACIAERSAPYVMAEGGSFCAAPPVRARSLEEAGRLAADLFRKQGR